MAKKQAKKPYVERTDLEKIKSQWVKLTGLHDRTDFSAAVVRAATAAEIAVNFAIRQEFSARSQFDTSFVDEMLKWANGLSGKIQRLLLPLLRDSPNLDPVKRLCMCAQKINDKRNGIAHRGEFCTRADAKSLIADCEKFVHGIVRLYDSEFTLRRENSLGSEASAL